MHQENEAAWRRIAGSTRTRRLWWFSGLFVVVGFLSILWLSRPQAGLLVTHADGGISSQYQARTYTAVIIETQTTANLVPLLLHFSTVLGPAWQVVLYTLEADWEMPRSNAFQRVVQEGKISIRFLPPGTDLTSSGAVSSFLAKPWLWEQLQESPRVLFFQTDSIICSKSSLSVENFLDYDFVGAPISSEYGKGYNGGLSIRNPSMFLEITKASNFATDGVEFEDQWFYTKLSARPDAKLPAEHAAQKFAVETIYYDEPLGYHQPSRWQPNRMGEIEQYCPEVKILLGRRIT